MSERYGIILIDRTEVIIKIYTSENQIIKLLRSQAYDLTPFKKENSISSSQIIEIIAEVSLTRYASYIREWKICARGLPTHIIKDISLGTSLLAEGLTLEREQELLCKGIVYELI